MGRSARVAALGLALVIAARLFDTQSLYVPGVALLMLAAFVTSWVIASAHGISLERELEIGVVEEGVIELHTRPASLA